MIDLRQDVAAQFKGDDAFDQILALQGDVYRQLEGRRTLRWERDGQGYFIKVHLGVGWGEIVKNLCSLRLPVLGASNEYHAIRRLEQLNLATMAIAGYGSRGWNPARRQSFLITDELTDVVSLEDFCRDWRQQPPAPRLKRTLIREVARIARVLHESGVNHRDFYLCHFLADRGSLDRARTGVPPRLHLIDLHRVQLRARVPRRWVVKDLGGLLFSSLDIGLTFRDYCRFLRAYRAGGLHDILPAEQGFWQAVVRRAGRIYRRDFSRDPELPAQFPRVTG